MAHTFAAIVDEWGQRDPEFGAKILAEMERLEPGSVSKFEEIEHSIESHRCPSTCTSTEIEIEIETETDTCIGQEDSEVETETELLIISGNGYRVEFPADTPKDQEYLDHKIALEKENMIAHLESQKAYNNKQKAEYDRQRIEEELCALRLTERKLDVQIAIAHKTRELAKLQG